MKWWVSLLALASWLKRNDGANVLVILPTPSFSHQLFYRPYLLELHKRGHNLTVATPDPLNNPTLKNYREIDLSFMYEEFRKVIDVSSPSGKKNRLFAEALFIMYLKIIVDMCNMALSYPNLIDVYKNNEKFDLVVIEWGLTTCFYPFGKLSDGKVIGISSFEQGTLSQLALGSVWNPAWSPDIALECTDRMTFLQRVRSTLYYWNAFVFLQLLKWIESGITRKYFGRSVKSVRALEANVSVVFENSHVAMSYPRANNINVIPLGGSAFHLNGRRPKRLPQDIKDFLEDAPEGVVYFSLGTNVKTNNISSREEEILLKSFSRIKQKVLWKWENENLKVDLKNVMKKKWFPQVDVLAHPNMKAFVTQAGLQSVGEAIEFHVPMVVMPFFADQNHNARKMEKEGAALYYDYDDLDVDKFTNALNEIVYNKKYKENIIRLSALVKDQPIPPLEKAVWWTEYVIRHNGAPHLRSAAAAMPWYQYFMLDVLGTIVLALLVVFYIVYFMLKSLLRILFKAKKKPKRG